jgi:hypothetical protein
MEESGRYQYPRHLRTRDVFLLVPTGTNEMFL